MKVTKHIVSLMDEKKALSFYFNEDGTATILEGKYIENFVEMYLLMMTLLRDGYEIVYSNGLFNLPHGTVLEKVMI